MILVARKTPVDNLNNLSCVLPMPARYRDPRDRVQWVVTVVAALVQYLVLGVAVYITPQYIKTGLHTSALTGRAWLDELLSGHPDRIYIAMGMHRHVSDHVPVTTSLADLALDHFKEVCKGGLVLGIKEPVTGWGRVCTGHSTAHKGRGTRARSASADEKAWELSRTQITIDDITEQSILKFWYSYFDGLWSNSYSADSSQYLSMSYTSL
jgi:hypothetical protein